MVLDQPSDTGCGGSTVCTMPLALVRRQPRQERAASHRICSSRAADTRTDSSAAARWGTSTSRSTSGRSHSSEVGSIQCTSSTARSERTLPTGSEVHLEESRQRSCAQLPRTESAPPAPGGPGGSAGAGHTVRAPPAPCPMRRRYWPTLALMASGVSRSLTPHAWRTQVEERQVRRRLPVGDATPHQRRYTSV